MVCGKFIEIKFAWSTKIEKSGLLPLFELFHLGSHRKLFHNMNHINKE